MPSRYECGSNTKHVARLQDRDESKEQFTIRAIEVATQQSNFVTTEILLYLESENWH